MEEYVRQRIREILKENNYSVRSLASAYSVNQATLNNQINRDTMLSVNTILFTLDKFPNISAEWLMRGKGEKFLNEQKEEASTFDENFYKDIIRDYQKMVEDLQKKNARLEEIVAEFSQKAKTA